MSAQEPTPQASIAITPELSPVTLTGVFDVVVELFPSCQTRLYPQHFAHPDAVTAQVWLLPAEKAMTQEESPEALTGTVLIPAPPFPSSPSTLFPQHFTHPEEVSAHEYEFQAKMPIAPEVSQLASTADVLLVVVPFPSSPETFPPKHLIHHEAVSAQVCMAHAAIAEIPEVNPLTSFAVGLYKVVQPFPSCP